MTERFQHRVQADGWTAEGWPTAPSAEPDRFLLRAHNGVSRVTSKLSPDEQSRVVTRAETAFTGPEGAQRARLVGGLLSAPDSSFFADTIRNSGTKKEELADILGHEGLAPLITTLFAHRSTHLMQIGLLGSIIPLDQFPEEAQGMVSPVRLPGDITLDPAREGWLLCERTEPRIAEIVENETIMVAGEPDNPTALLSVRGRPGMLMLQDALTDTGHFMPKGTLYCPDRETRKPLEDAFDAGKGRIAVSDGRWAFMRPVTPPPGESMETYIGRLNQQTAHVPSQHSSLLVNFQGMEMTRREYRLQTSAVR